MKKINGLKAARKALCLTLSAAVAWWPVHGKAEDIDLFVSNTASTSVPNVLIVLDNSANWSSASQHWPGGKKQGQSELSAIKSAVEGIRQTDSTSYKLNLGLMMFTEGQGSDLSGGYIRFAVRPMTQTNINALKEIIGDDTCTSGYVTVGTSNITKCIYKNFDSTSEKVGTSNTDYSAAMFEAYKYFGAYSDVANAKRDTAGVPPASATSPHSFASKDGGVSKRRAGTIPSNQNSDEYRKFDAAAYTDASKTYYSSPISTANSCAKNYIVFIGNGFPASEPTAWDTELLANVNQASTQQQMPEFTTTSTSTTTTISTQSQCANNASNCASGIPQSLKDSFPGDSYACINQTNPPSGHACNQKLFDVTMTKTVFTVTSTGKFAVPASSKTRYADEWAKFLAETDVSSHAGQQTVTTYTIDVFKDAQDADQTALMQSMARYGGGKYFSATSEDAILDALEQIMVEIQATTSVFAAAALPIANQQQGRFENKIFIGLFRPDSGGRPRWYGNLKRYQAGFFSGQARLADADGALAESLETGLVAPCARSYWTEDSGTYWNFIQAGVTSFAGTCTTATTSLYSDQPDGAQVEKGSVAEILRRGNIVPLTDSTTTPTPVVPNRTLLTCKNENTSTTYDETKITCNTASAMHSFAFGGTSTITNRNALGTSVVDDTEATRIVDFIKGVDFAGSNEEDTNKNTMTTDVRPDVHGDVVHSRPLPVNYGTTGATTGVYVFYGSNDGTFRAINGETGQEKWAFVAPEHHQRLKRYRDNLPLIKYPNSTDSTAISKHYFMDGSTGLYQTFDTAGTATTKAWIFPSQRRGGRMLYGFNVLNPADPRLMWRVGCPSGSVTDDSGCTAGFSGIGQTWSAPLVAKIKGHSETDPVLIVGGGYDDCWDQDAPTNTTCFATGKVQKGKNVYVINAQTGAIIKTFGTGGTGTIDASVAADVALVDRSFTGFAQHAYVADVQGNIYRIDFVNKDDQSTLTAANWTITKIAYTTGSNRRFLWSPSVTVLGTKVYVALGSGDRERPLNTNYPYTTPIRNRFYTLVDSFPSTSDPAINLDTQLTDITNDNSCSAAIASTDKGWRLDLNGGCSTYVEASCKGEQAVGSAAVASGVIFFSTNRPVSSTASACTTNLGEARGYAVNLLNGSGVIGGGTCGGERSNTFAGGGLPPSPVIGTVLIDGKPVTTVIGGIDLTGAKSSQVGLQQVKPSITQKRSRQYWYRHGDK